MMPQPDFRSFAYGLWRYHTFPRQPMLAERVAQGSWPRAEAMDLPTPLGKAACIDVVIHTLASQADQRPVERTAPRRVWFVVDRRIVWTKRMRAPVSSRTSPPTVMDEGYSGLDLAHPARQALLGSLCEAPQKFRASPQGRWIEIEDDIAAR